MEKKNGKIKKKKKPTKIKVIDMKSGSYFNRK